MPGFTCTITASLPPVHDRGQLATGAQALRERRAGARAALESNASSLALQRARLHQALLPMASRGKALGADSAPATSDVSAAGPAQPEDDAAPDAEALAQFARFLQKSKAMQVMVAQSINQSF